MFVLFLGTYGNRQVLSVETNGPFTHVFDFWHKGLQSIFDVIINKLFLSIIWVIILFKGTRHPQKGRSYKEEISPTKFLLLEWDPRLVILAGKGNKQPPLPSPPTPSVAITVHELIESYISLQRLVGSYVRGDRVEILCYYIDNFWIRRNAINSPICHFLRPQDY